MCVCPSLCVYVPVYVCMSQFMCVCPSLCVYVPVYVCMSQFMCVCPSLCVYVPVYVCMSQFMCVCPRLGLLFLILYTAHCGAQFSCKHISVGPLFGNKCPPVLKPGLTSVKVPDKPLYCVSSVYSAVSSWKDGEWIIPATNKTTQKGSLSLSTCISCDTWSEEYI